MKKKKFCRYSCNLICNNEYTIFVDNCWEFVVNSEGEVVSNFPYYLEDNKPTRCLASCQWREALFPKFPAFMYYGMCQGWIPHRLLHLIAELYILNLTQSGQQWGRCEGGRKGWRKKWACRAPAGARAWTRDLPRAWRESVAPRHGVCFDK